MFIESIKVNNVRHLKDFSINLGEEKKHLIITGKNGSGKTTLLGEINEYMYLVQNKKILQVESNKNSIETYLNEVKNLQKIKRSSTQERDYQSAQKLVNHFKSEIEKSDKIIIKFNDLSEMMKKINEKEFIVSMFGAKRNSNMQKSNGVEKININNLKGNRNSQHIFLKYLVHLKTQLAYAMADEDKREVERINEWFDRFTKVLRELFENEKITLKYNRKEYDFTINDGEREFDFNSLSDGFSSVIDVITGIMMSMEKEEETLHDYDMHGIIMIDEIETHLHISLQKKIFKVLNEMFPNIQFIVTTHSPFILNSVSNCVIYDLESREEVEDLTPFSYDVIVEGYFNQERYNEETKTELEEYEELAYKKRDEKEEDRFQELKEILREKTSKESVGEKVEGDK